MGNLYVITPTPKLLVLLKPAQRAMPLGWCNHNPSEFQNSKFQHFFSYLNIDIMMLAFANVFSFYPLQS